MVKDANAKWRRIDKGLFLNPLLLEGSFHGNPMALPLRISAIQTLFLMRPNRSAKADNTIQSQVNEVNVQTLCIIMYCAYNTLLCVIWDFIFGLSSFFGLSPFLRDFGFGSSTFLAPPPCNFMLVWIKFFFEIYEKRIICTFRYESFW